MAWRGAVWQGHARLLWLGWDRRGEPGRANNPAGSSLHPTQTCATVDA